MNLKTSELSSPYHFSSFNLSESDGALIMGFLPVFIQECRVSI